MLTEQGLERRDRFLKILFEGTTSHNSSAEILAAFSQAADWAEASQTCTYYQGCGVDLITLACDAFNTHVMSDSDPGCKGQIFDKMAKLAQEGLISKLKQKGTRCDFEICDAEKSLMFTTSPIDQIDFEESVGKPLGLVFEYNCGDSARKRSFWQTISKTMVNGGNIIGSYERDFESANRTAFVLETNGKEPILCGCDDYDDVQSEEKTAVIAEAEERDAMPADLLDVKVIEHEGRIYKLQRGGRDYIAVSQVWRQEIGALGLRLMTSRNHICHLTKVK